MVPQAMTTNLIRSQVFPSEAVSDIHSGDGAALLDTERGLCFSMNPSGARIWQLLKLGHSPGLITKILATEFAIDELCARKDVVEFIDALHANGLLRDNGRRPRHWLLRLLRPDRER